MAEFRFQIPFQKAARDDGWYIVGTAAGTDTDLEGQRLSKHAIEGFVGQINGSALPFRDWHAKNTILGEEIGEVSKAWIQDDFSLGVEVKLDEEHPTAQYLWKRLGKGKQYGMSVGGNASKYSFEFDRDVNKSIMVLDEVILDELSVTTKPVYTKSFGTVLRKAIDEAEAASAQGDKSLMGDTPKVDVETTVTTDSTQPTEAETVVTTTSELEVTAPVTPEAPVEKAVTADNARDSKRLARLVKLNQEQAALIAELGLSDGAIATSVADSTTEPTDTGVEKSLAVDDFDARVEKAVNEKTAPLVALLEQLKDRIPGVEMPPVLVYKSQDEQTLEAIRSIPDPLERLHVALAAMKRNER